MSSRNLYSPVFVELFSQDSTEDTSNVINIDPFDACDSAVFHNFILYIYSEEIENMPDKNYMAFIVLLTSLRFST